MKSYTLTFTSNQTHQYDNEPEYPGGPFSYTFDYVEVTGTSAPGGLVDQPGLPSGAPGTVEVDVRINPFQFPHPIYAETPTPATITATVTLDDSVLFVPNGRVLNFTLEYKAPSLDYSGPPYDGQYAALGGHVSYAATATAGQYNAPVNGCTDPTASNFNPLATVDDGSCVYPVRGCMDPTALNYNPLATVDDGSCVYPSGGGGGGGGGTGPPSGGGGGGGSSGGGPGSGGDGGGPGFGDGGNPGGSGGDGNGGGQGGFGNGGDGGDGGGCFNNIFWDPVSGALSYTVERSTSPDSGFVTIATGVTNTYYEDPTTHADNGRVFYYRLRSVDAGGAGAASPNIAVTTHCILLGPPVYDEECPVPAAYTKSVPGIVSRPPSS